MEQTEKINLETLKELIKGYDAESLDERAERYSFLLSLENGYENTMFRGKISHFAFEAAGSAYINAKFIGSVVLAQMVIDQSLNQMFLTSDINSSQWNFPKLLEEAEKKQWITKEEHESFNILKDIRNPYVHYKKPLHKNGLIQRMIDTGENEYEILEKDAQFAIEAMYKIVNKFTF